MSNTITLKKSAVSGNVPSSSDLSLGEIAINYADGHLYYKSGASETPVRINAGDADTLDGSHASAFLLKTGGDIVGNVDIDGEFSIDGTHKATFGQGHYITGRSSSLDIVAFDNSAKLNLVMVGNAGGKSINFITSTSSPSSGATTVGSIDDSGNATFSGTVTAGPGTTGSPYDSTTFLHVKGTTRSVVQQSSTADAYYMFGDAAANNVAWLGYSHSNGSLSLQAETSVTINKSTTVSGDVTATSFHGDGSNLTGLSSSTDNTKLPLAGGDLSGALSISAASGNTLTLKKGTGTAALAFAGSSNEASALFEGIAGGGLKLYTSNGGTLSSPSWSPKMTVLASGNVGIGVSTPSRKLHIVQASSSEGGAYVYSNAIHTGTTTNSLVSIRQDNASATGTVLDVRGDGTGDKLIVWDNTSASLIVKDGGNVGIGTDSPDKKLDLTVSTNDDGLILQTTSGRKALELIVDSGTNGQGVMNFYTGTNLLYGRIKADSEGLNLDTVANRHLIFKKGGSEVMRINTSGNVGIGTGSPTAKLHIAENSGQVRIGSPTTSYGGVGFAGSLTAANAALWGTATKTNIGAVGSGSIEMKLGNDAGGNGSLKMEADKLYYTGGNLGIGTTSPDHELHVKGDITIDNESSTEPSMLHFNALNKANHDPTARINFWEGDGHTGTYTNSHAYIEYNGSTAGGGDGYLAIGGSTNAGANSDIMVINRLGRVGIGVASPATQLHVAGRARFDDSQINARGVFADYFSSGQSLTLNSGADASILFKIGNTTALTLDSSENATFAGDVVVSGGLTINGTTTTINSTTISVDDKNIELGSVSAPDTSTADGGGITLLAGSSESDHKTIKWINSTDAWTFNTNVSASGLDINGAADISGNLEVGEYILRSGQGSNYHRFLASRQIFVVGNASSIDLNNGTSTFGATGGATTLQGSSLLLDSAADITIDADGGDIILKDGGTIVGTLSMNQSGGNFEVRSRVSDKDLVFKGVDGSSEITALTLDMSDGGAADFGGDINLGTGKSLYMSGTNGLRFLHDGSNGNFINGTGDFKVTNGAVDKDIIFRGNDGGSSFTALTIDMSDAGTAIFNHDILPATSLSSDLGSSSKRFASLFCQGLSAGSSVTTPTIQLQGNLKILNKAQTAYLDLATRDTSGGEVVYNLSRIGSATLAGNVGIGTTGPSYKLDVNGGVRAGGKVTYEKSAGSLNTTGYAVAGLTSSYNGDSAGFTFTSFGHSGGYQKIVYSCYNATGTWNTQKVIDEGTNDFDVTASANGSTITFTFKSRSGTKNYTPRVSVEASGGAVNTTYA